MDLDTSMSALDEVAVSTPSAVYGIGESIPSLEVANTIDADSIDMSSVSSNNQVQSTEVTEADQLPQSEATVQTVHGVIVNERVATPSQQNLVALASTNTPTAESYPDITITRVATPPNRDVSHARISYEKVQTEQPARTSNRFYIRDHNFGPIKKDSFDGPSSFKETSNGCQVHTSGNVSHQSDSLMPEWSDVCVTVPITEIKPKAMLQGTGTPGINTDEHDPNAIVPNRPSPASTRKRIMSLKIRASIQQIQPQQSEKPLALRRHRRDLRKKLPLTPSLQACDRILTELFSKKYEDFAWPFYEPVDPVEWNSPDYFTIITDPMDLSTIRKKLHKRQYAESLDFADDMKRMLTNCYLYNDPTSQVFELGKKLEGVFRRLFSSVPQKCFLKTGGQSKPKSTSILGGRFWWRKFCLGRGRPARRKKHRPRQRRQDQRRRRSRTCSSESCVSLSPEHPGETVNQAMDFENFSSDESETERERMLLWWQERLNFLRSTQNILQNTEDAVEIRRLQTEVRHRLAEAPVPGPVPLKATTHMFREQQFRKNPFGVRWDHGVCSLGEGAPLSSQPKHQEVTLEEVKRLAEDIHSLEPSEMGTVLGMIKMCEPGCQRGVNAFSVNENQNTYQLQINYELLSTATIRQLQKFVVLCQQNKMPPPLMSTMPAQRQGFGHIQGAAFDRDGAAASRPSQGSLNLNSGGPLGPVLPYYYRPKEAATATRLRFALQ